ncbi:MAG: hypothetical protein KA236_16760, partial [Verrucomicrobia bacterium]|nr:hypothetical protein [Verrucomicrobiota bacterium]
PLVGLRSAPASRRPPPDAPRTTTEPGDIISRVLKGTFLKSFDNAFSQDFGKDWGHRDPPVVKLKVLSARGKE